MDRRAEAGEDPGDGRSGPEAGGPADDDLAASPTRADDHTAGAATNAATDSRVAVPANAPGDAEAADGTDGGRPEDRREGFHFMDVVMGFDMLFIAAILLLAVVQLFMALGGDEPQTLGDDPSSALWVNNVFVFLVFGVIPFLWILTTRVVPWRGTVRYFQLERPLPRILLGLTIGILSLLGAFLVGLAATAAGVEPDNLAAEAFAQGMTWPLVFGIALSAAFGEEIFFRGVLQKHIGWWGQAIVFAVPHVYQGVFAVALILGVGLLFGWVVRKGAGLWTVITAHFFFNFVQLTIIMVTR